MNSTVSLKLSSVEVNLFPGGDMELSQKDEDGWNIILINTEELKEIYDFVKKELLKRK